SNVSGQSFSLIDRGAYTAITAELGARTAQAIRGLNYDKANWQQILTGAGNVTVNVPDGSQYTGPSWLSLANSLSGINDSLSKKANSADLGNAAKKNIGSVAGTVAAGDDVRFKQGAMEGGTVTYANGSPVGSGAYSTAVLKITYSDVDAYNVLLYGSGNNKNGFNAVIRAAWGDTMAYYQFNANGNAYAPAQWVSNSDSRIKDNINKISEPLSKMTTIRGVTWDRKDGYSPGVGFIAQSV
ncbi:tail fiber domain-containing protein, partial [Rosenbergiella epipactidis]|uniref:tail fiber domain-containing protein n=1 Tax=Rosenbergiella epipactidis TaxID=1544694 RepID=UPI001F50403B